jgi:Ran GTPase-activating protein (RanGAP) involved in mRNA processing and transport
MYTLANIDAFRTRVISHVYSDNQIGNEGAEALARSVERNSSLTSLNLSCTLCRYGCVPRAHVISHVYSGNQIGNEGAEALARALERNSSLIHLHLDRNTGADSAACTQYG